MKVYIYSHHIIALIIFLGQNMGVQNVILPRGLYFYLPQRRRPGTGDIATPPIRLSVCLSVRRV